MSPIFKHLVIDASLAVLLFGGAKACADTPAPEPKPTQRTDERGMPIEKPVPTGCKGKIADRVVAEDGSVAIFYYTDSKCSKMTSATITEEEDLNGRCWEGYFPQCLRWEETEPPGVRQPSDPAE